VLINPSEDASFRCGTWLAISTTEAAENPANTPISARAPSSCHTSITTPISTVHTEIANAERSTISLRPYRSAIRPQIGEANAATNEATDPSTPDQR
jgi:hypothetical protein